MRWMVSLPLLLWCLPASAEPGDHIRVGKAEITPSIRTGFEFHSNVYQKETGEGDNIGAPFWFLHPSAEVKLDGPWVVFSLVTGYSIRVYIDPDPKDSHPVDKLNRFNDVDVTTSAQFLPNRPVGFKLSDRFSVQDTPTDLDQASAKDEPINVVHTNNALDGGVIFRPGSALDVNALGSFSVDYYHVPDAYVDAYPDLLIRPENNYMNNRLSGGPTVNSVWRFLPKTSLVGMVGLNWNDWEANLIPSWTTGADGYVGDVVAKPNSMAWRTSWGVKGQISTRLAASIEAGFGQMYYDETSVTGYNDTLPTGFEASSIELELRGGENAENYARDLTSFGEGLLISAQASYTPIRGQSMTLAFRKDFQDILFSNYSAYYATTFRYDGRFFDRLGVGLEYAMRLDRYHGEIVRGDWSHRLKLEGGWQFTKYLTASLGTGWTARYCADTNCQDPVNPLITFTQVQYDDLWVQGSATFTY